MALRLRRRVEGLRSCPVCRSRAISSAERQELDEPTDLDEPDRFALRCGGCGTWRVVSASPWDALRLEWRLGRDRRHMRRLLRRLEAVERNTAAGEPAEAR